MRTGALLVVYIRLSEPDASCVAGGNLRGPVSHERPTNAKVRIIPANDAFVFRGVVVRALVEKICTFADYIETMCKSWWYPQYTMIGF
jgi:hypothetical protein